MKDLCHHIRNATTNIEGLLCHLDKGIRLEVHKQLKRIENELFVYQSRGEGMTTVELIRLEEGPEGTFGVLKVNKRIFCMTLEPKDMLNEQNISCIPAPQQYTCQKRMTKYGETFEAMNVPGRAGILFHSGNFLGDTLGCILLGQYTSKLRDERGVFNSGNTMKAFMEKMKDIDSFLLTINYKL